MNDHNPYASPQSELVMAEALRAGGAQPQNIGPWRDGNLLVMHKNAVLPDRCVKSNQPAHGRRLKRNLSWHHPAIFLAILVHLFIYIILALALRKTATIYIGLSDEWFARRRRAIIIGWGLLIGGMVALITGIAYVESVDLAWLLILAGIMIGLGGALYGAFAARMVAPKRITDTYIWLKGVHPDFLADLPRSGDAARPDSSRSINSPRL